MRLQLTIAAMAPLALAAPFWGLGQSKPKDIPALSVDQWQSIQGSFVDGLKQLSTWSWEAAAEISHEIAEDDDDEPTLWDRLQDDEEFSKLVKILKDAIPVLKDSSKHLTFFAPTNDALTPPKHGGHHGDDDLLESSSLADISAWIEAQPASLLKDHDDDDDDEKHKKRREIIRKIIGKVLKYHGTHGAYTGAELAQNSTFPTSLKAEDGSYGGLYRRIKVEPTLIPPSIKINGYARVVKADIKASNGYIHAINHPLLPPPSIIDEAFLFPDFFSAATSSIQKVHGTKYLDWTYDREESSPGHPKFKGVGLTTFFLPSNVAFGLLPPRLKFFLFSPFGERALEAILRYHAVPDTLLLSEFVYHHKDHGKDIAAATLGDDLSFHKELDVHSAFNDTKLHVAIDKSKVFGIDGAYKISVKVNGLSVETIDVPSRNGAFHVINKVLVPPHKHHDDDGEDIAHLDSWENWEDWLPTAF